MKKIIFLICLLMPLTVNGASVDNFDVNMNVDVNVSNEVNGSSYYAGNKVESSSNVEGILVGMANDLTLYGDNDYTISLANVATYSNNVLNDAFIAGNTIEFTKDFNIGRDLNVVGNIVTLDGTYGRDIYVAASEVTINSTIINGEVKIIASKITISENVNISKLTYNEDAEITIADSATILETVKTDSLFQEKSFYDQVIDFVYSYAISLFTFLGIALLVPSIFKKINKKFEDLSFVNIFSTVGMGALTLIAVPIVILLLLTFVFGIELGFILLGLYVGALFLTTMFSGYLTGLLFNKIFKRENNVLITGLIGISIIKLLLIIPVVDIIFVLISLLLGMGIVLKLFTKN